MSSVAPEIAPEVAEALAGKQPVVAFESTIVTHGLAYPDNLEVALAAEQAVRDAGAVPASIAVIEGEIRVGLSPEELERLASAPSGRLRKCSRRDLPVAVGLKETASTTVAGTMVVAKLAGIDLFATGGIGGVHRGQPFDISADLQELARSPVAVVCAGAKAILDLPKTLEVLETLGVPVIGYGSDTLPAFYSRDSGLGVPARCDTPQEVAAVMAAKWALGLGGGLIVANPIPVEDEIPAAAMEAKIAQAQEDARAEGIEGKAVTPFLLGRLEALTGGASLTANVALVRNNARLAAAVADAYCEV